MKHKINIYLILFIFVTVIVFLLYYAIWLTNPGFSAGKDINIEEIVYRGTLGDIYPLHAVVCYKKRAKMPIVVLMHEYSEINDRYSLMETAKRFANRNFFVVVPDMRGRGIYAEANLLQYNISLLAIPNVLKQILIKVCSKLAYFNLFRNPSAGKRDSSGKEIHDIYDCAEEVKKKYKKYVDQNNINIIGYSGGGGNVMASISIMPDYFNVAASYFGISDYADWYSELKEFKIKKQLSEDIGGDPHTVISRYDARKFIKSGKNSKKTKVYLFVDHEDEISSEHQSRAFSTAAKNSYLFVSNKESVIRYEHGNPKIVKDLIISESVYVDEMYKNNNIFGKNEEYNFWANGFIIFNDITVLMGSGEDSTFKIDWIANEKYNKIFPTRINGEYEGKMIFHNIDNEELIIIENNKKKINLNRDNNSVTIRSENSYKIYF